MAMLRLDKYMADAGKGTRSQVKSYIKKGLVSVNGVIAKTPDTKVDTDEDEVIYEGEKIVIEAFSYYMLNKPAGVVSATKDGRDKTVVDLITEDKRRDLFPVGRLDKDTEGLLIITNDGKLANDLLSPKKHVAKTYLASVAIDRELVDDDIEHFKTGIDIGDDTLTKPAILEIVAGTVKDDGSYNYDVKLIITEGRFHQVKRMFAAIGGEVTYLKRLSMGGLTLDENLPGGSYRKLTPAELELLTSR